MKYSKLAWIAAAVGLFSACQTAMDRRISAHQETWHGLSQEDQQRLLRGHVGYGDTEEMVRIALGPPDKLRPITGGRGQTQTVWVYDLLEFGSGYAPFDPDSSHHLTSRERSVVFQDGVVTTQMDSDVVVSATRLAEVRAKLSAQSMTTGLDSLVALTPEQKAKAAEIFEKANAELLLFSPGERPAKGMSNRAKLRADIRALLTTEQQARFDAAHGYLGSRLTIRVVKNSPAPH